VIPEAFTAAIHALPSHAEPILQRMFLDYSKLKGDKIGRAIEPTPRALKKDERVETTFGQTLERLVLWEIIEITPEIRTAL